MQGKIYIWEVNGIELFILYSIFILKCYQGASALTNAVLWLLHICVTVVLIFYCTLCYLHFAFMEDFFSLRIIMCVMGPGRCLQIQKVRHGKSKSKEFGQILAANHWEMLFGLLSRCTFSTTCLITEDSCIFFTNKK